MIYDNVCRIAKDKNIAITTLESKAGLGRGAIGKWRTSSPTMDSLEKVAKALKVSVKKLLD